MWNRSGRRSQARRFIQTVAQAQAVGCFGHSLRESRTGIGWVCTHNHQSAYGTRLQISDYIVERAVITRADVDGLVHTQGAANVAQGSIYGRSQMRIGARVTPYQNDRATLRRSQFTGDALHGRLNVLRQRTNGYRAARNLIVQVGQGTTNFRRLDLHALVGVRARQAQVGFHLNVTQHAFSWSAAICICFRELLGRSSAQEIFAKRHYQIRAGKVDGRKCTNTR